MSTAIAIKSFENSSAPVIKPAFSCGRDERLKQLQAMEAAGLNKQVGKSYSVSKSPKSARWDDELVTSLSAMSEADLAEVMKNLSAQDTEFVLRACRRVKLRAETADAIKAMEAISDEEMQAVLARLNPAERLALAEIAEAWA